MAEFLDCYARLLVESSSRIGCDRVWSAFESHSGYQAAERQLPKDGYWYDIGRDEYRYLGNSEQRTSLQAWASKA